MLTLSKLNKTKTLLNLSRHTLSFSTSSPLHTPSRRNPKTAHYDDIISEAGQAGDFTRLRHLLIERINKKSFNSKDTFNFINTTHSSVSTLDNIFAMLASLPPGIPRRNAFESFIKRLCIIGLVDHALHVLGKMHQGNLERNSFTCYPVIKALVKKSGGAGEALGVLKEMCKYGVVPDTTAYNYLLTTYCMKSDSVGNVVEVLEAMVEQEGIRGDSRTYDAMVLGACKARKVEGAVAIVRAAVDDGVTLMHCTYEHVIKALVKEGFYAQAFKFVECFAEGVKRFDDVIFGCLVNELVERKRFGEMKTVVDEMRKRNLFVPENVEDFCLLHGIK